MCPYIHLECNTKYVLSKYFGNTIIVEKQRGQGKSNTVFSSSIPVSEAINAANNLKDELKFTEAIYELLKNTCMLRLFFDWYSV
jgi:hypothetical protein